MVSTQQIKRGVVWTAIERFSAQGIQFILSLIIARLLSPSDYGLIAMLSIFIGLSQNLVDSGFVDALVQKNDKTEIDYSTAFYFNLIFGIVLYGILFLSAPYIAAFYNEPKLISVTRVFGLITVITSLGLTLRAKMLVALNFKKLAVVGILSVIISGSVGLWMAYDGYGVWALVTQTLLNYFCNALFMWLYIRWMPCACFSMESFRSLFGFGIKLLASSMLHTLYTNLYTLVIGKKFLPSDVGYFNRAQTLSQFPSMNISQIFIRVSYPVQCQLQDKPDELKDMFLRNIRMSCYIIFPLMIGIAALAEPFIRFALTEQWLPAVPLLQLLSIAYMWNSILMMNTSLLSVKGRTDFTLKAEIIKKVVGVSLVLISSFYSLAVMCISFIIYSLADFFISAYYVNKVIKVGFREEMVAVFPFLLLSASMGGIICFITSFWDSSVLCLSIGFITGVCFYGGVSWMLRIKEFNTLLSVIKKK